MSSLAEIPRVPATGPMTYKVVRRTSLDCIDWFFVYASYDGKQYFLRTDVCHRYRKKKDADLQVKHLKTLH